MPCYEVRTMSVEFKAKHRDVLEKALDNLGWRWSYNTDKTKVFLQGIELDLEGQQAKLFDYQQRELNVLKQAYSSAALDKVARMKMWMRKNNGVNKGMLVKY